MIFTYDFERQPNTIYCTKCPFEHQYPDEEEFISQYFGYNRLNQPYKTCIKCRAYVANYRKKNKERLDEYKKEYLEIPKNREKREATATRKVTCPNCSTTVTSRGLPKHKRTIKCQNFQKEKEV
jgi:hypothetical protein